MYRTLSSLVPARRSAALAAAATLAGAAAAGVAGVPAAQAAPAHERGGSGAATATVLRAGLDLSLLNRTVDVPVDVSLDDVRAPADAKETALTVAVGHGVEGGRPVGVLRARVATADATADRHAAEGYADVADAQIHVPGLPLLALVELDAVSSRATCVAGHRPTASSQVAGLTVLGRHVSAAAVGTTRVAVPGVGTVSVGLTQTRTTTSTAAATALDLAVRLDPLGLGVAAVTGEVTVARATCRTPREQGGSAAGGTTSGGGSPNGGMTAGGGTSAGGTSAGGVSGGGATGGGATSGAPGGSAGGTASGGTSSGGASSGGASSGGASAGGGTASAAGGASSGGSTAGAAGPGGSSASGGSARTQTVTDSGSGSVVNGSSGGDLAETGAGSTTPYVAGTAAALVAAGAAVFLVGNRRRRVVRRAVQGAPEGRGGPRG